MLGERNSIAWSSLPLPKRETDREGGGESDREDRKREVVVRKRMQCVLPGGGICTTEETGSDQVSTEVSEHEKVLNAAFFSWWREMQARPAILMSFSSLSQHGRHYACFSCFRISCFQDQISGGFHSHSVVCVQVDHANTSHRTPKLC